VTEEILRNNLKYIFATYTSSLQNNQIEAPSEPSPHPLILIIFSFFYRRPSIPQKMAFHANTGAVYPD